ncbi:MAG: endolytic transglycosylase MltG [Oscillospiraceae bacterium]|jgi:UPF0755 protein
MDNNFDGDNFIQNNDSEPEQNQPDDSTNSNTDRTELEKSLSQDAFEAFMSRKPQPPTQPPKEPSAPAVKSKRRKKKKKNAKRTVLRVLGSIFVIVLIFAVSIGIAITIISFGSDMLGVKGNDTEVYIDIPEGASTDEIAALLKNNNIIEHELFFKAFVILNGSGGSFYPDEHKFTSSMSYQSIISELKTYIDKREVVEVMFKEGIRLVDAANLLEENGVCDADEFIKAFNADNSIGGEDYDFSSTIKFESLKLFQMEGYLFPDTYVFYKENTCPEGFDNVQYTIEKIKKNYNDKMSDLIERIEELDMPIDEVMTLASIIQAEAGNIDDMEMVSSVFWNRLNSDDFPKLQSDPTGNYVTEVIAIYSDAENEEMNIAYDTYQGEGLPPGAICNPGLDAIKAALYPAESDYYFFCSNVETKEFYYAKTNAEHDYNLVLAGIN